MDTPQDAQDASVVDQVETHRRIYCRTIVKLVELGLKVVFVEQLMGELAWKQRAKDLHSGWYRWEIRQLQALATQIVPTTTDLRP